MNKAHYDRWIENKTKEQYDVHQAILEFSCDLAEEITNEICEARGIEVYKYKYSPDGIVIESFTEDAQDVFNEWQSRVEEEMYKLANTIHESKQST